MRNHCSNPRILECAMSFNCLPQN